MTRDNVLFILIGVLIGFIAGYVTYDIMSARQPPRLIHGDASATAAPLPGQAAAPGAGAGQAPGQAQAQAQARTQEIELLEERVRADPGDAEAVLRLGLLSYDTGRWQRCVEMFERFLEIRPGAPGPDDADLLSDLGVCYKNAGDPQQALASFDRAQEVAPQHWQSRFNEVVVLAFDLGRFEAAEDVLEELRALQPDNPSVAELAAEVERRRGAA